MGLSYRWRAAWVKWRDEDPGLPYRRFRRPAVRGESGGGLPAGIVAAGRDAASDRGRA